MAGLSIECNPRKIEGNNATEVRIAVNGLTGLELANALDGVLQALVGSDETRPAFLIALKTFVKREDKARI